MADQNSRGFRKFMLDPKSSVMTYIADNIPPEHLSHQQGSNNGRLQNGQQPNVQDPNRLPQSQIPGQDCQNQSQDNLMRPPLPTRPSQSNSQSSSPRPGYAQPVQSSQMPMNTPYIASNVGAVSPGLNAYAGAQSQLPGSQSMSNLSVAQESMSQQGPQGQYSSIQNGSPSAATLGQGPPQPGMRRMRRRSLPQSAPRLYHRMMLEFEITKKAFFAAKSQHNIQEMTSTAYELESTSRRLWGLRYEHSWEFEGYSEAGHQAAFSKWQAEYEMWADAVLDIQDGQFLADAANAPKYGNTSMHRGAQEWDSQARQAQLGFQELNAENKHHSPSIPQEQMLSQMPQQMPQLQHLSVSQPIPPAQSMQNSQPPQSMPPGEFSQTGPPAPISEQSMPPQQRQQSPQPPQMPMAQNVPPAMQNGHYMQPDQFNNGSANMQNFSNSPAPNNMQQPQNILPGPNMQQPQNMTMQPGQAPNPQQAQNRPPQQYMQQGQSQMPSNMQQQQQPQPQNMGAGQQGPPRNPLPPGQNMGPRSNPSPRPGSQMPPSLQAGGQMQGNGRP